MAEMDDRWLSVDEIGKHLGVSIAPDRRQIDKHAMSNRRRGGLIKIDEIGEWMVAGDAADKSKQDPEG